MKKTLLILALAVISAFVFWGCNAEQAVTRKTNKQKRLYEQWANLITLKMPKQNFYDLNKGLQVIVQTTQPNEEITGEVFHYSGKSLFETSIAKYIRALGLTEMSAYSDLSLIVKVICADVTTYSPPYSKRYSRMDLEVSLLDPNDKELFTQKNISASSYGGIQGLNEAYTSALEQINWNRIASFLRTEQQPKEEPNKQVQGYGDTALENTIIRWDVQSRPQGADVFWRVVSKTPEVKSTNEKHLQTTPYEATKSLDIRGLTYQTAGDVRIILRCEKDGYMPQEKEYNVRMVLDQEEISAFFRLVKEE